MTDIELQEKWEKRLQRYKLGVDQPLTQTSKGGELGEVEQHRSTGGNDPDYSRLRKMMDGSDQFMDGFEIKKVRTIEREIPEWTLNYKEVLRVLMTAFPKLSLDKPKGKKAIQAHKNRIKKAGRWARIIQLYYRMQLPTQIVAAYLGITETTLEATLRNIGRVERGLTVRGEKRQKETKC